MATPTPAAASDEHGARLALANRLFRKFHAICFWSYRPDLTITEEHLPWLIRGLRAYGGEEGLKAASELLSPQD